MLDAGTKAISKIMNLFLASIAVILISKGILMFIPS
jgi:small neutral amino acid transporter SnatA (MarC family)